MTFCDCRGFGGKVSCKLKIGDSLRTSKWSMLVKLGVKVRFAAFKRCQNLEGEFRGGKH